MDYDESSDILGGRLHVSPQSSSLWVDPGQITLFLGFGLAALYTWARLAPHYRQWRETRYRKAMRRRHGIPDDDNRPFNVAYAAASQARKRPSGRGGVVQDGLSPSLDRADERLGTASHPLFQPLGVNGGYGGGYQKLDNGVGMGHILGGLEPPVIHPASQQDNNTQTTLDHRSTASASRKSRQNGTRQPLVTRSLHGKHALDDEVESNFETHFKKTRVEGEDLIDGDAEAGWHDLNKVMDVDELQPIKRGSKRVASTEDDEGLAGSRADRHDKRARKISLDKSAQSPDHDMEDDELEEDDADAESAVRGKKRDRDEAGSTFGGDDSLNDDEEKPQRRRRRRTTSNKLHSFSRGQKRGRDLNSPDSDVSDSDIPKREFTRKKRGRRNQDESAPVSNDPLCKGRRIGEEWESNGILYKVGPNGQRLRQELVRKSRSRFPMPSDSQHPDRRAHVDVYVETWLSEEEYMAAKERNELAWQDTPVVSEPQTPGDVPDSPSKIGKNLLWSSTMASRESPIKRGVFRQSIATNIGLRLNVFPPPPGSSTRRISSVYQVPASPVTDSPKMQKSKSYSKWEKQDLEAAAMSKLRDRQQAAHAGSQKSSPSTVLPSAPVATMFSTPSPSATTGEAPEQPSTSTTTTFSFAPTATKPTAAETPKTTSSTSSNLATAALHTGSSKAPSATSSFAPPAATPSTAAPPASSALQSTLQTSPSIPNFFAKPTIQAPTQTATSSASAPNLFTPRPATQSSAGAGLTTAAAPAQPNGTAKPAFSFGAPSSQQAGASNPSQGNEAAKTEQSKSTPGASLLSRLGMGPPPTQSTTPAAPMFAFSKPDAATPSAPPAAASDPTKVPSTPAGVPKFNFGMSSKPSSNSAPAANGVSAPTSTTPSSTLKFSFGVNSSGAQPATSGAANPSTGSANNTIPSSAPTPTFLQGTPMGTSTSTAATNSPFGATPSNAGKTPEAPKSAFSFGNNSSMSSAANPSPFGGATATGAASPFGAAGKTGEAPGSVLNNFGGAIASTSSPSFFGSAQNFPKTDVQAPKPTFSFGTSSASTPTFGANPSSTPGSAFGAANSSTPTFGAPMSSAPTFGTSTPAFGTTNAPGSAETKPSPFSFNSTNAATPSMATPTSNTENKPTFSFNFGAPNSASAPSAPPSAFGTTTSPFGTPATNQPSQPSSSSTFGFGAPSGAFAFGSGQNTQK